MRLEIDDLDLVATGEVFLADLPQISKGEDGARRLAGDVEPQQPLIRLCQAWGRRGDRHGHERRGQLEPVSDW